jgi:hypothetical protein
VRKFITGFLAVAFLGVLSVAAWKATAADEPAKPIEEQSSPASEAHECCKAGEITPPTELVEKVPPGELHSPYPDYAKLAKEEDLVKDFRLPGCNECHGGGGGGGMCPALSQGIWFWGNTDDVLFRLVTMPPMGFAVKTSDDLWKIIAFIRSINPPGANPPEKVVPGRYTPPGERKPG